MALALTQEEIIAELQRRGVTVSTESVLDKKGSSFEEFKKFGESLLKGSAKGIIDIVGGWGNLYDYLKNNNDPNAFSSSGIARGLKNMTGVDVMSIPGYRGAYEFGQAGAPQAATSAVGLPGLFSRTPAGLAGEFGVAGSTGLLGQMYAPESPLVQLAIGASPYAIKSGLGVAQRGITAPVGQVPADLAELQRVGPLTPGQATGSRVQLAEEARVAAIPKTEQKAPEFRLAQTSSVADFVNNLFERSASSALSAQEATNRITTGLNNYGKALSNKLKTDAQRDFKSAAEMGGQVDVTGVLGTVESYANSLPSAPGLEGLRSALGRVSQELSANPTMPIDILQKNLSAWGDAAWSGSYALKGSNVFEGVAPGQVKGIARQVLRSYRDALDSAIDQGIPGAQELKKARDSFSANLDRIDEFAEKPFVKTFGKTANELVPEEVINKLRNLPPSQRNVMIELLQSDAPELLDTVRSSVFGKMAEKASLAAKSAPEGAPPFSIDTLLGELQAKKSDFDFLFSNPKDKADALLAIKFMQKISKTEAPTGGGGVQEVGRAVAGLGGGYQTRNLVAEIYQVVKDVIADPNKIADVVFDPDTVNKMAEAQRKGKIDKAKDLLESLTKSTAKFAPRVGPMISTDQPIEPSDMQEQPQSTGFTKEQIREELRSRGIEME